MFKPCCNFSIAMLKKCLWTPVPTAVSPILKLGKGKKTTTTQVKLQTTLQHPLMENSHLPSWNVKPPLKKLTDSMLHHKHYLVKNNENVLPNQSVVFCRKK